MIIDLRFTHFPYIMWGLKKYLESLEESITYQQRQYPIRIKAELENKGYQNDDPEADIAFQEIHAIVEHIFPRTLRNSFIVVLWASFESLIKQPGDVAHANTEAIVNYISQTIKTKLKFSAFQGGFVDRLNSYLTYISEVTGKDLNLSEGQWAEIKLLYAIRNAIAHGSSTWDNVNSDIKNKLQDLHPHVASAQLGEILLTKEFLEKEYFLIQEVGTGLIEKTKSFP